jgi:hypothetical protein
VLPSYQPGVRLTDLASALPDYAIAAIREALPAFDRQIRGFAMPDAVLTGVETRTSSPLRITRGDDCQSVNVKGLYPAGEGAGYAGGILSAGVDGIRVAEAVTREMLEHAGDFAQCLVHVLGRHMMQGLEHDHDVEGIVLRRDRLGATLRKADVGQVSHLQVAGVLDGIDLQGQDLRDASRLGQCPGLLRLAAAQFEHAGAVEGQFVEHQFHFVDQRGLRGVGNFHERLGKRGSVDTNKQCQ